MLDIDLLRADKGGQPNLVKESQRKRYKNEELVDRVVKDDLEWRQSKSGLF